jgi:hypothetical protein
MVPGSFAALRMTAETSNDKNEQRQGQKQIPFGDDKQKRQRQKQTTTRATAAAKYRDLSAARWTVGPSIASVEMTFFFAFSLLLFLVLRFSLLLCSSCSFVG